MADQAETGGASRGGYKQGLPVTGLRIADESARQLWESARRGHISKTLFGKNIGFKSITSGSFKLRLALLRGFGLVVTPGDAIGLSELGFDLVQTVDDEKQMEARRRAVLSLKAYREVVDTFDGTKLLSKDKLSSRFQYEYGKPESFAAQAAEALIDSLKYAEMLDGNEIVHKGGINASSLVANPTPLNEAQLMDEDIVAAELDEAYRDEEFAESESTETAARNEDSGHPGPAVSLSLTLDLSQYQAQEVIEILRAMGLAH
jgi:hypothetical protein